MANPEHIALIERGPDAVKTWRKDPAALEDPVLDLSEADLNGKDLSRFVLDRANLSWAKLGGAKLAIANHADMRGADLRGADLKQAQLAKADLSGAKLGRLDGQATNLKGATLDYAKLHKASLNNAILENASVRGAVLDLANADQTTFTGADLTGVSFRKVNATAADFENATLSKVDFFESSINNCVFRGAKGLETAKNLTTVQRDKPYDFEDCHREWQEKYCDWERISSFGRLRLLGVSYTALAAIIFYVYMLSFYNEKVVIVKSWAATVSEQTRTAEKLPADASDAIETLAHELDDSLQPQPPPQSAILLVSAFILLAIASTIYQLRCPEEVKQFSRVEWCHSLDRTLAHYWPHCWKDRWARLLCLGCYAVGAFLGLWVVITKVCWVLGYLVTH